jgi:hypothetical protein
MPEPLTDPLALVLLDHFRRQPYEPAHLGALRDRLDELGREDLVERLACYDESYVAMIQDRKATLRRGQYRQTLRRHAGVLAILFPEISTVRREAGTG